MSLDKRADISEEKGEQNEQSSADTTISISATIELYIPGGSFNKDFLKYEQSLPTPAKYGGERTSKRAHGVMALKAWMLPPLLGKRMVVSGADISQSLTSFAGLAASSTTEILVQLVKRLCNGNIFCKWYMFYKEFRDTMPSN